MQAFPFDLYTTVIRPETGTTAARNIPLLIFQPENFYSLMSF
jgi:hypothetical protein